MEKKKRGFAHFGAIEWNTVLWFRRKRKIMFYVKNRIKQLVDSRLIEMNNSFFSKSQLMLSPERDEWADHKAYSKHM